MIGGAPLVELYCNLLSILFVEDQIDTDMTVAVRDLDLLQIRQPDGQVGAHGRGRGLVVGLDGMGQIGGHKLGTLFQIGMGD